MDRGGLSGDDGPTHHGLFDISYLRGIPNMVHMVPKDEDELADMMFTALHAQRPQRHSLSARHGPRRAGEGAAASLCRSAKPKCSRDGDDDCDLRARRACADGAGARRDAWSAKASPPRSSIRASSSRSTARCSRSTRGSVEAFVTFEDHVLMGGFGSAVLEALSEMGFDRPVVRIGWPDQFIEHGKVDALRAKHGISVEAALEKLEPLLKPTKHRLVAR